MMRHTRLAASLLGFLLGFAISGEMWAAGSGYKITTVSGRPDKISGGDVLVRVTVPANVAPGQASIRLNGQDVTAAFHPDSDPHVWTGLVQGLNTGANKLEVFARGAGSSAEQLTLVNYPITGPVFSG